jgi:DNA-binding transcriptional MerR regulator
MAMTTSRLVMAEADAFSIGDLASELNITTRTIRYYEERGLISPGRTQGRQRVYTRRDRGHLKLILRHREAGFSIEEMKELLDIYDAQPNRAGERRQMARFRDILLRRLREVDRRIAALQALRSQLQDRLDYAEHDLRQADSELD